MPCLGLLRYASVERIAKTKARDFDWRQTPGPRAQRLWEAIVQALYDCLPPALSSAVGRGGLGLLREPTYRLYNCRRCAIQGLICAQCDHGNIYCGRRFTGDGQADAATIKARDQRQAPAIDPGADGWEHGKTFQIADHPTGSQHDFEHAAHSTEDTNADENSRSDEPK